MTAPTAPTGYLITPNGSGKFNVSRDGCNPMPGATHGFESEASAKLAIRVLEHTKGSTKGKAASNPYRFWDLLDRVTGATQRRRDEEKKRANALGMKVIRTGRHETTWSPR